MSAQLHKIPEHMSAQLHSGKQRNLPFAGVQEKEEIPENTISMETGNPNHWKVLQPLQPAPAPHPPNLDN